MQALRIRPITLLLVALILSLALTGCSYKSDNNSNGPTAPGNTIVEAFGLPIGLDSAIQFTDDSKCWMSFEEVACASISWEISYQATGEHFRTVPSEPKSRVQTNGVPAGDYAIEQTAMATDGATGKNTYTVTVD